MLDSELDSSLGIRRTGPYVYKGRLTRILAWGLDFLGDLWLAPPPRELDWTSVQHVAVLRLDHLGDLLNAFPALQALRRRLPQAKIDLFVGPWSAELARLAPGVNTVHVVDAPWFQRPERVAWPWAAIWELGRTIARGNYDLAIELRGDLRHHLALAFSATPLRLGHAITAGRFLLTHPGRYEFGLHEIDQNLALLGAPLGGTLNLRLPSAALEEAGKVIRKLGLKKGFVAVQAACGTPAKRWMPGRWAELIRELPRSHQVVLLGAKHEREEMQAIAAQCGKRKVVLAAGLLSLEGLAAFLKEAKLLISLDSGPAHLAAAVRTPVLGLYSGTNLTQQWGVRGRKVRLIRAEVPCSPCELTQCPYANECMRRIEVNEVLQAARKML